MEWVWYNYIAGGLAARLAKNAIMFEPNPFTGAVVYFDSNSTAPTVRGFFMGNLYTQIVRVKNPRINILSELKQQWNNRPIDFKAIRELQKQLSILDEKYPPKYKKVRGIFG